MNGGASIDIASAGTGRVCVQVLTCVLWYECNVPENGSASTDREFGGTRKGKKPLEQLFNRHFLVEVS